MREVDFSTINGMSAYGTSSHGIEVNTGCTGSTFTGISVNENGGRGMLGSGLLRCTVSDVTSYSNDSNGVQLTGTTCTFSNMTSNANGGLGVSLAGNENTVSNVTAHDNTGLGFEYAGGYARNNVSNINAHDNAGNQISLGTSSSACKYANLNCSAGPSIGTGWTTDGISTIAEATDTNIATPASGQILIYDGTDSWDNKAISGDVTLASTGAVAVTKIHGDLVDTGTPATDDKFVWNGTQWDHTKTSRVRAYKSGDQTVGTTIVKITWENETYDTRSEFDTTADKFTATEAGYYLVQVSLTFSEMGADSRQLIQIRRSGTTVSAAYTQSAFSYYHAAKLHDVIYMTAGQYLEVWGYNSSGNASVVQSESETHWEIHKMI